MSQSAKTRHEKRDLSTRFFDAIEKVGNKLPDPFLMFVSLAILVIIASAIGQALNASVVHPQTNEDTPVKSQALPRLGWCWELCSVSGLPSK